MIIIIVIVISIILMKMTVMIHNHNLYSRLSAELQFPIARLSLKLCPFYTHRSHFFGRRGREFGISIKLKH